LTASNPDFHSGFGADLHHFRCGNRAGAAELQSVAVGGGAATSRIRTDVEVRPIRNEDVDALTAFFACVPEGDRTFFKEDVSDATVIAAWAAVADRHRLLALVDDQVAGYVAVRQGIGWSSHVGELRLVIAPEYRHRGIGRLLAQRAVAEALELGVVKLVVEVVAGQERLCEMFTKLGFEQEGRLRRHVRSAAGETSDLLVLSHFVDELAASLDVATPA
jgi:L-amino acid N-acyltransferase YncA